MTGIKTNILKPEKAKLEAGDLFLSFYPSPTMNT